MAWVPSQRGIGNRIVPITFTRKSVAESDPILATAQRMERAVRDAFLKAVDAAKGTVALDKLAEALAAGDENGALAILALDKNFAGALRGKGLEAGVQSFRDAIQATYAAGAKAAIAALPEKVSVELSFNLMSQGAVSFLETYDLGLIQQLSDTSREAIRQTLLDAFQNGGHPYEQAREIRNVIGLTTNQMKAVENFRSALENPSTISDALSRSLRDGRYDSTLLRAAQNNTPLSQAQIDKMTSRYQEKYLRYRAETIARTETVMAGQKETWSQAEKQGLLGDNAKRVWVVSGDDRTCGDCEDLDGEEAGMDEEFAPGIMYPPDPHPDCRCSVSLTFS